MKEKSLLYVANWKMQLSYTQAVTFARDNKNNFTHLAKQPKTTIVLCPSFDALSSIAPLFKETAIEIGAQNCAPYSVGAYTGEVAAQSLQEIGCTYCIVGHSERRTYFNEDDTLIAQKVRPLLENSITPIVCIGETKEQYEKKETYSVLRVQLEAVMNAYRSYPFDKLRANGLRTEFAFSPESIEVVRSNRNKNKFVAETGTKAKNEHLYPVRGEPVEPFNHIVIAYEPIWAIGTGIPATPSYIQEIIAWIAQECDKNISSNYTILYGGSVNGDNTKELKTILGLGGFLIGNASLDFQKFQNIVLS